MRVREEAISKRGIFNGSRPISVTDATQRSSDTLDAGKLAQLVQPKAVA
jgi:hypothetical protein